MNPVDRLIVALDVPGLADARDLADSLAGRVGVFKVGLEQYVAHGPAALEAARAGGAGIFLDLKIHDIPRTAAAAVRSAGSLDVRYTTLHALGGPAMIAAAREAAESLGPARPRLLAVTVLTSHSTEEWARIGVPGAPADSVVRLATMAIDAGADGVVASPQEAAALRGALGPGPLIVTPGIRSTGDDAGDQARIATPADAIRSGASLIVVGRPIVKAPRPRDAAARVLDEIAAALGEDAER